MRRIDEDEEVYLPSDVALNEVAKAKKSAQRKQLQFFRELAKGEAPLELDPVDANNAELLFKEYFTLLRGFLSENQAALTTLFNLERDYQHFFKPIKSSAYPVKSWVEDNAIEPYFLYVRKLSKDQLECKIIMDGVIKKEVLNIKKYAVFLDENLKKLDDHCEYGQWFEEVCAKDQQYMLPDLNAFARGLVLALKGEKKPQPEDSVEPLLLLTEFWLEQAKSLGDENAASKKELATTPYFVHLAEKERRELAAVATNPEAVARYELLKLKIDAQSGQTLKPVIVTALEKELKIPELVDVMLTHVPEVYHVSLFKVLDATLTIMAIGMAKYPTLQAFQGNLKLTEHTVKLSTILPMIRLQINKMGAIWTKKADLPEFMSNFYGEAVLKIRSIAAGYEASKKDDLMQRREKMRHKHDNQPPGYGDSQPPGYEVSELQALLHEVRAYREERLAYLKKCTDSKKLWTSDKNDSNNARIEAFTAGKIQHRFPPAIPARRPVWQYTLLGALLIIGLLSLVSGVGVIGVIGFVGVLGIGLMAGGVAAILVSFVSTLIVRYRDKKAFMTFDKERDIYLIQFNKERLLKAQYTNALANETALEAEITTTQAKIDDIDVVIPKLEASINRPSAPASEAQPEDPLEEAKALIKEEPVPDQQPPVVEPAVEVPRVEPVRRGRLGAWWYGTAEIPLALAVQEVDPALVGIVPAGQQPPPNNNAVPNAPVEQPANAPIILPPAPAGVMSSTAQAIHGLAQQPVPNNNLPDPNKPADPDKPDDIDPPVLDPAAQVNNAPGALPSNPVAEGQWVHVRVYNSLSSFFSRAQPAPAPAPAPVSADPNQPAAGNLAEPVVVPPAEAPPAGGGMNPK